MAKKKKDLISVSGMSIQDILNKNPEWMLQLNKKELQMISGRLVSAGNKRLRRIEELGLSSESINPAYNSVMKSGGVFSTKGKSLNELRSEFARASSFMGMSTSTKSGAKAFQQKVIKSLGIDKMNNEQIGQAFNLLHKLQEKDPNFMSYKERYEIMQNEISMQILNNADEEDALTMLMEKMEQIYQAEQELDDSIEFRKI